MGKIVGKFSSQFQAVCFEVIALVSVQGLYGHSARVSTGVWWGAGLYKVLKVVLFFPCHHFN